MKADTQKRRHTTYKSKIRRAVEEKMRKQSNAWIILYWKYRQTDRQLISEEDTFLGVSRGDLKAETEGETITAQGQAFHANNIAHKNR